MKIAHYEQMMDYLTGPRERFRDGGRIEFQAGTYPKTNPEDLQKLRNYLKNLKESPQVSKLSKQFNIARKTIDLILKREFPNLVATAGERQAANVAKMNELRKKATEAEYEKILKEGYLDDYKLKIKTPSGSPFSKGLTNAQLAKKYFSDLPETAAYSRVEKLNRYIRTKYPDLTYPPGEPTSETSKRRRERILEQRKFLSEEEKKIRSKQQSQKKILNKYFSNNPEEILNKTEIKKLVDVRLKDGKLDFTPRYKTDKEYIDLAKRGLLFDEYDITPVRLEKRNIEFPINKNITPAKFNQGFIKQVDAYYKKTKGSTDPEVVANKKIISNFLDSYGLTLETRGERIGSLAKLPAINKETGDLPNIKNTLNKLGVGNLSVSKDVGLKKRNIEKAVKELSFKPSMTLGSAGDVDMAKYLLTKDATAAKNLVSKYGPNALKVLRTGLRGTGVGLALEAPFEVAFALPALTEGDFKKAYANSVRNLYGIGKDDYMATAAKEFDPKAKDAFDIITKSQRLDTINEKLASIENTTEAEGEFLGDNRGSLVAEKKQLEIDLKNLGDLNQENYSAFLKFRNKYAADVAGNKAKVQETFFKPVQKIASKVGIDIAMPFYKGDFQSNIPYVNEQLGERIDILDEFPGFGQVETQPELRGANLRKKMRDPEFRAARETERLNFLYPASGSFAGGGVAKLAGKPSGPPPASGPLPQGLDFLIKRGRQS